MFHTFLNAINDFSGGASTGVGLALPPIAAIAAANRDLGQQPSPHLPTMVATAQSSSATMLEAWLDNLPMRGWDA